MTDPPEREAIERRVSRRAALGLLLGGAALAACGGDGEAPAPASGGPVATTAPTQPSQGGAAAPAGWRQLATAGARPPARKDHSLVLDPSSGRLVLFGGRSGGSQRDDLWLYDLGSDRWQEAGRGTRPAARFGHNAVFDAARRRMLIFGGQAGSAFFNDLWAYDVGRDAWTKLGGEGPSPRYGSGGALDEEGGAFYVTHGFTDRGRFDDSWRFDLAGDAWRDVSPAQGRPLARCLLRAAYDAATRSFLLFGGQSNSAPFHNDLWRLDVAAGAWEEVQADPRPGARNLYAAAFDPRQGRMLVHGGKTAAGSADDLWSYSQGEHAWTKLEPGSGPQARNSHDAVFIPARRSLVIAGGASDQGELNDLWELSLA
jgi:hypothetical protein